jgi:ABC-type transport system involved in cytochrome c biogenesis permease subunit
VTSTETSEGEKARPSAIAPMAVRIMAASLCAVIGGPVFGAVGRLWWRGPGRLRGLGAAVLAAASLAEAAVSYGWRLHYTSSAILFAALGVAVVALLGLRGRHYPHVGRW